MPVSGCRAGMSFVICSLRDQKQFAGGCTACHRGMGAGGVGKAIGFADRHLDRSVPDPVEKLFGSDREGVCECGCDP